MMNNSTQEFERLLGKAALALWPDFPRHVQENLFEAAVPGDVIISKSSGFVLARPSSENGASSEADAITQRLMMLAPL